MAGLALALAIFTRPHVAVVALVLGVYLSLQMKSLRPALSIGWTSSFGVIALILWNGVMWGSWSPLTGGYEHYLNDPPLRNDIFSFVARWIGTLISLERGVLIYSPFLVMLAPGLRRAWRAAPNWVKGSAIAGISYLSLQLWFNRFSGGDGFVSYRLALETLLLASPLLVLCWVQWTSQTQWRRRIFAGLLVVAVFQHAVGAFVGWNYRGARDPWTSYLIPERLAEATSLTASGLMLVTSVTVFAAWRIAKTTPESLGRSG